MARTVSNEQWHLVRGFSLSPMLRSWTARRRPVLVGATVDGVNNGTISTEQGNFENTGDDVVLSEHFWINFANVTIVEGYIPFSTIALITGTVVTSSGAAGADFYAIRCGPCQHEPADFPMAIRVPSKDTLGQIRTLDFVLYAVQFQPFNFTGPTYKTGLSCSIAGRALFSGVSETNEATARELPPTASGGWRPRRQPARRVHCRSRSHFIS